jgi:subtilisin family serine protease
VQHSFTARPGSKYGFVTRLSLGWMIATAILPVHTTAAGMPLFRDDRILIKPKAGIGLAAVADLHAARNIRVLHTFRGIGDLQVLSVPTGESVTNLVARYQRSGLVEFAEPDYEILAAGVPDDPYFADGKMWGLNNFGQNGGVVGADIRASSAWDVVTSASNVVIAVVDSGIRATHEDLASNMWVNPIDGGHGFNAFTATNDPSDDNGHGTQMAGILGAVGNNGKGVVGAAWQVQIMDCKCLTNTANGIAAGSDSDLIACVDYARTHGARIINASLAGTNFSAAVSNAIESLRDAGIVFVSAAGNSTPPNSGIDIDVIPSYPASYRIDNIVPVAYSTRYDELGQFSNYGANTVALAAPGEQIYSTTRISDNSYLSDFSISLGGGTGTSQASAYVSGACALMMAQYPADNYRDTIARLLEGADLLPSLAGKCRSGGRLNLYKALRTIHVSSLPSGTDNHFKMRVSGGLSRTCVVEASTNLVNWLPFFTNTTSASGTFDFTNSLPADSLPHFFRATAAP